MPTLYLRDVPERVVAELRRRAAESRRSLSAEAVVIIEEAIEAAARRDRALMALRELADIRAQDTWRPGDPTASDLIREARQER